MKPTQSILILLALFLTFSFSEDLRVEIIKRYDNGNKKLLVKYRGEGVDEVVVERITYSEKGDTLILEKPLENYHYVKAYKEVLLKYPNGNTMVEQVFTFSIDEQQSVLNEEIAYYSFGDTLGYANYSKDIFFSQIIFSNNSRTKYYNNNGQIKHILYDSKGNPIKLDESLSDYTKNTISKLNSELVITVYFSSNLPGEYGLNARYITMLLSAYTNLGLGNINYEFINVESEDDIAELAAQKSGIQPVQLQVIENDNIEIRRVYMGMKLTYNGVSEIIPVIQTSTGLEFDITSKILSLINSNKYGIKIDLSNQTAIVKTSSQIHINNSTIDSVLSQYHYVNNITLDKAISDKVSTILMNGVESSLKDEELSNLKQFLNRGGKLFLAQGRIKTDLASQTVEVIQSNIFSLLESYGIQIQSNLVLDENCGKVNVEQNLGFIRIPVPMDYPFLPIIKEDGFSDNIFMVSELESVRLMFPSEIVLKDNANKYNITPLFNTSNRSSTMVDIFNLSPDPKTNTAFNQLDENGKLVSVYCELNNDSKIILVSDSNFLIDNGGGAASENHLFVLNAIDYLFGNQDIIELKYKEIPQAIHDHYFDVSPIEIDETLKEYLLNTEWMKSARYLFNRGSISRVEEGEITEIWDKAIQLREDEKLMESITSFKSIIKDYPLDDLAAKSQFQIADIYLNDLDDFEYAVAEFKKVIENYPEQEVAKKALFMLAYISNNYLNNTIEAKKDYLLFIEKYPNDALIPSVEYELQKIHSKGN